MKIKRKIIRIDEELCDGCGQCVPSCAEGALAIVDGKAKVIADKYCDGLGACLGECPTGALKIIERVADDFDEEAVEELLAREKNELTQPESGQTVCACQSAQVQTFRAGFPIQEVTPIADNAMNDDVATTSALVHWPVQIRLVPPTAPFLNNADLLIAADCTPIAYANFHRDFLANRVVLVGCPKFDDFEAYVQKFTEIFNTAVIKSITIVIMEVPCCAGMRIIIRDALRRSGKKIDSNVIVISARGGIIQKEKLAA